MKWNSPKPVEGDIKIKRKFAWTTKRIGDKIIWLEWYTQLYEYRIRERYPPPFIGKFPLPQIKIMCGDWDLINEKPSKL